MIKYTDQRGKSVNIWVLLSDATLIVRVNIMKRIKKKIAKDAVPRSRYIARI